MKKAFTILEILVVLSVIAVLVGIAVPKFKGMQDESKVTQVKRELKTLQAAVESYSMNSRPQAYPPTSATISATSLINAVPQIVSRVLYDPFGAAADSEYNYILSDNGRYYTLCSAGPDRASETSAVVDEGVVALGGDDLCVTNGMIGAGGGGGGGGSSCAAGQADCGSGCQDILSDVNNCGSCGNVCGDACVNGSCADLGALTYPGSVHTGAECVAEGGAVTTTGEGTLCKFAASSCPSGWNKAGPNANQYWSTTTQACLNWTQVPLDAFSATCNGVTRSVAAQSGSSGTRCSESHPWSNTSTYTTGCCVVGNSWGPATTFADDGCLDIRITRVGFWGYSSCDDQNNFRYILHMSSSVIYAATYNDGGEDITPASVVVEIGCK